MKNGGHAFPNITPDMNVDGGPGMTLRDYFAAAALPASLAVEGVMERSGWQSRAAWRAYSVADAMIREREEMKQSA